MQKQHKEKEQKNTNVSFKIMDTESFLKILEELPEKLKQQTPEDIPKIKSKK